MLEGPAKIYSFEGAVYIIQLITPQEKCILYRTGGEITLVSDNLAC